MIYLQNTTDPQLVRIPANGVKVAEGDVVLELVNTIDLGPATSHDFDRRVYLVDALGAFVHDADGRQVAVAAAAESSRLYYVMRVALEDGMPEGEYEYTARVGETVVSCGLLIVGTPTPSVIQYDKPLQYEQYRNE